MASMWPTSTKGDHDIIAHWVCTLSDQEVEKCNDNNKLVHVYNAAETQLTNARRRPNRTYCIDGLLPPVQHLYGFAQQIHQSLHAVLFLLCCAGNSESWRGLAPASHTLLLSLPSPYAHHTTVTWHTFCTPVAECQPGKSELGHRLMQLSSYQHNSPKTPLCKRMPCSHECRQFTFHGCCSSSHLGTWRANRAS